MGIWQAAKRGEGYQLARESNITWVIVFIAGFFQLTFRFLSGRPMMGDKHRKTDATFLERGTVALDKKARPPSRWAFMPEYKRAIIRMGVLLVVLSALWLYLVHPGAFGIIGYSSALIIPIAAVKPLRRRWKLRAFNKVYLKPIHRAVTPLLNIPPHYPLKDCIEISPDLPGLVPGLVKPMGKTQLRIRAWYGEWLEPSVRYIPERVMRLWWWLTGNRPSITKAWRHGK
ncbi:MAG: hypothetical protein ACREQ5_01800 [Candidatus Dormibacteria bacterium]